jgi:hypothetical protein
MEIKIEIIPTDNPRVHKIGDRTYVGRAELRRALLEAAEEQIRKTVDQLFPPKRPA